MADTRAERMVRVDAAVACHRSSYLNAVHAGHDGEAQEHEGEVDRLLDLRNRIERRAPISVTEA